MSLSMPQKQKTENTNRGNTNLFDLNPEKVEDIMLNSTLTFYTSWDGKSECPKSCPQ
jgi:hypothetical protein